MITLKDGIFVKAKKNKEPEVHNFSFDKGFNRIVYSDRKIYNFLLLEDAYLESGQFLVDDIEFYPNASSDKSLFALLINSKNFSFNTVFVLPVDEKVKFIKEIEASLKALKDMPLTTPEEESNKVLEVLKILVDKNVSYVALDFNKDVNVEHYDSLMAALVKYAKEICFIVLEQKPDEPQKVKKEKEDNDLEPSQSENLKDDSHEEIVDIYQKPEEELLEVEKEFQDFVLDIGSDDNVVVSTSNDEPIKEKKAPKKSKNEKSAFLKALMKNVYLYYVFAAIFSIFVGIAFFSVPFLLTHDKVAIGVVLLILNIIFFFVDLYVVSSTYIGMKKYLDTMFKKVIFVLFFSLSIAFGLGGGLGIIYALGSAGIFIDTTQLTINDMLLGIIGSSILIVLPVLCSPMGKIYVWIVKLLKKIKDSLGDKND